MKAKKALKRLAKIEALMSDVTERLPKTSLQIQVALKDAKDALGRAMAAVSLQASSEKQAAKARSTEPEPSKPKLSSASKVAVKDDMEVTGRADEEQVTAAARKKNAAKTMAVRARTTKTTRKRAPIRKAAKQDAAAKETVQAPVEIPATVPPDLETAPAAVETAAVAVETTPAIAETTQADIEPRTEPAARHDPSTSLQ
jgi:hypothetical protein